MPLNNTCWLPVAVAAVVGIVGFIVFYWEIRSESDSCLHGKNKAGDPTSGVEADSCKKDNAPLSEDPEKDHESEGQETLRLSEQDISDFHRAARIAIDSIFLTVDAWFELPYHAFHTLIGTPRVEVDLAIGRHGEWVIREFKSLGGVLDTPTTVELLQQLRAALTTVRSSYAGSTLKKLMVYQYMMKTEAADSLTALGWRANGFCLSVMC